MLVLTAHKVWLYIKNYWYVPVLLVGIVVAYVVFGKDTGAALLKYLNAINSSHQKELDALNKARDKETAQKEENYNNLQSGLKQNEEEYQKNKDALESSKETRETELSKQTPEELTDQLGKLTGIEVKENP